MLLATQADFEPTTPAEIATALYWNPSSGEGYREYPFFQERVDSLIGRFAPNNQKLLIAGCGFGYLVAAAVTAGYDAYGADASAYAIGRGQTLLPAIAARLVVADMTTAAGLNTVRAAAGLVGQQKFALGVTEDLLPCLTDTEVTACLSEVRNRVQGNLLHICTTNEDGVLGTRDPRLNWKTAAEWKAIVSPPDVFVNEQLVQV